MTRIGQPQVEAEVERAKGKTLCPGTCAISSAFHTPRTVSIRAVTGE